MQDGAVYLHDREPSIESCDLGVSIFRVPREAIAEMPVEELLTQSLGEGRAPYEPSEVRRFERDDLEVVWLEQKYIEKTQNRDAHFRVAIARGAAVCLNFDELLGPPRRRIRACVGRSDAHAPNGSAM